MARQDFYELHLYLPKRFKELLKERAAGQRRSISAMVEIILEQALEQNRREQPPPA
jgi:hypothetical protein